MLSHSRSKHRVTPSGSCNHSNTYIFPAILHHHAPTTSLLFLRLLLFLAFLAFFTLLTATLPLPSSLRLLHSDQHNRFPRSIPRPRQTDTLHHWQRHGPCRIIPSRTADTAPSVTNVVILSGEDVAYSLQHLPSRVVPAAAAGV